MQRTNQAWLEELQGQHGNEQMAAAHHDLARYLYSVAYRHLFTRQSGIVLLNTFDSHELSQLTSDFVQQTLEKLVRNDFALLKGYEGRGSFTGYMATIILNEVRQELRGPFWQKRVALEAATDSPASEEEARRSAKVQASYLASPSSEPEATVVRSMAHAEVGQALQQCVDALNEMRRTIFWEVACEGRSVQEVAAAHEITANAASLHLFRARQSLRECLERKGITAEVLADFTQ